MTQTETDIDLIVAYIKEQSDFEPNAAMLKAITGNGGMQMFQCRTWIEGGKIDGLAVFTRVMCPFQNAQGWAMTLDLRNGHPIDLDLGLNKP